MARQRAGRPGKGPPLLLTHIDVCKCVQRLLPCLIIIDVLMRVCVWSCVHLVCVCAVCIWYVCVSRVCLCVYLVCVYVCIWRVRVFFFSLWCAVCVV